MPPKRQQMRANQRLSQHVGALSLDKGHSPYLAPPESTHGSYSPMSSSLSPSPQPPAPPDSPDLALMGAPLPNHCTPPPSDEGETLRSKTFDAKPDMPTWMREVTAGFAKEVSQLMREMDTLRAEKQKIQLEISTLMNTLSQYSPGGQFAPRYTPEIAPDEGSPSGAMVLASNNGPPKAGWRTVSKKMQMRSISANNTPKLASQAPAHGHQSHPSPFFAHQGQPSPPPQAHGQMKMPVPQRHASAGPALLSQQLAQVQLASPAPSNSETASSRPSWTTWKPAAGGGVGAGGGRYIALKAPVAKPPATVPSLFGE